MIKHAFGRYRLQRNIKKNTICDTERVAPLLQSSKSGLVPETGTDDPKDVTSREAAEGLVEFLWIFGRLVI